MIPTTGFVLKWIPKRSPHWAVSLLITIIGISAAVALRVLVVGSSNSTIGSTTLFPALIIISLYAGWRWSAGSLILIWALLAVGVTRSPQAENIKLWLSLGLYFLSAVISIAVAGALRGLVLNLEDERLARLAAEGQSRESEERFGTLADAAPTLMWVSKPDKTRAFVNAAYMDFMGISYEEALALNSHERVHPDDIERLKAEELIMAASGQSVILEARYRRADGEWRWLRSISRPRRTASGEFDGYIGIAFDVTDSKQAEQDLKGINDLLAERVNEAMAERDKAQADLMQAQKLEAVGQLTGGVAHDFNNLLTVIIGALDIIQRHPEDERRRNRMAEAALAAARRGEQLNQQLLAFARRQPLHPVVVGLDAHITGSDALLQRAIGESVDLSIKLSAEGGNVLVDPGQLEAAVLNLLINARDAVEDGGAVAMTTSRLKLKQARGPAQPGDYVSIAVADTGKGMDAETMAHVFEPFFTTKPKGKGTGLGLSQVYGFAKQSGGIVDVVSVVDQGTTVTILLPVSTAAIIEEAVVAPKTVVPLSLRILLVEDDADVAELVEAMLKELGHVVVPAVDAKSAMKVLTRDRELSLMLTDVIMPGGKNGVELAREVAGVRPELPIILSSGYTGESLAGAEAAPWPLLRKPYTLEALSNVIAETVQRGRPH
jgi:PAS domain S-box-containing protein